ncbi:MAG: hypothetical protein KY442_11005, partial [Proteobacteria bacterium]|nr:hypothetical protein [Pseudomonadota bacterium]
MHEPQTDKQPAPPPAGGDRAPASTDRAPAQAALARELLQASSVEQAAQVLLAALHADDGRSYALACASDWPHDVRCYPAHCDTTACQALAARAIEADRAAAADASAAPPAMVRVLCDDRDGMAVVLMPVDPGDVSLAPGVAGEPPAGLLELGSRRLSELLATRRMRTSVEQL